MAQIKDLKRMCAANTHCGLTCELYPAGCSGIYDLPDNADEIIDEWVKEHPLKTYAQDFLEKFPNAMKSNNGQPMYCRANIYGDKPECHMGGCEECWNTVMEE